MVELGDGFVKNDFLIVVCYGFKVINVWKNDEVFKKEGLIVVVLNGILVGLGEVVEILEGMIFLIDKGMLIFVLVIGLCMVWLYFLVFEIVFSCFIWLN